MTRMIYQSFPEKTKSPTKSTIGKKANKAGNILICNEIKSSFKIAGFMLLGNHFVIFLDSTTH